MITEDYVSFETAKLLKEKGFKEWCFKCYGVAVLHNGADISFDEECELKDEGRENEIEYVEGGRLYDYGCNNRDKDAKVWAAPTLWVTMKWLREVHHIFITIEVKGCSRKEDFIYFKWSIAKYNTDMIDRIDNNLTSPQDYWIAPLEEKETYERTCEAAIKYCLENLI